MGSDYYNLHYDPSGLSNTSAAVKKCINPLESAKSTLSGIKVPSDFNKAGTIHSAINTIAEIIAKLKITNDSILNSIRVFTEAQAKNNNIIASLLGDLKGINTNMSNPLAKTFKFSELMKKEILSTMSDPTKRKYYGQKGALTNLEYIEIMKGKLNHYDSNSPYKIIVDADNCKTLIFESNEKGSLQCVAVWNSINGANRDGCIIGNNEKFNWQGPRSRSFTGVWEVSDKTSEGYKTCYCIAGHSNNIDVDNDQGFEPSSWGNPDTLPLEYRHESHGCTNLSQDKAEWIYNNIPVGTRVVIFDQCDPLPHIEPESNDYVNSSEYENVNDIIYEEKFNMYKSQVLSENSFNNTKSVVSQDVKSIFKH